MCDRDYMKKVVRKTRPDYNKQELEDATGICMLKLSSYKDATKIEEGVKRLLNDVYKNSRGYDLTKDLYKLTIV